MKFPPRESAGQEGGGENFLKIGDGKSVSGILRGEVVPFFNSRFGKNRFRSNFVVNNQGLAAKIWEFGPKIYDTLSALESAGWNLHETILTISRSGSTKENTKYTVTPNPKGVPSQVLIELEKLELHSLAPQVVDQSKQEKEFKNGIDGHNEEYHPF